MRNNPKNVNLYVRHDLKTPSVNVQWVDNNGTHRNKSFGPAHFVEAWLLASSFYQLLAKKQQIDQINNMIKQYTHIEHDLLSVPDYVIENLKEFNTCI